MKKYKSGSFTATKYAIYKEDTDTITSFPASIIANGGNITPWTVYGNTVEGESVGDKTKNLFDKANTTIYNAYFNTVGNWLISDDAKSVKFPCLPNTQYTLSIPNSITIFRIYESSNPNLEPTIAGSPTTEITRNANIEHYTFTTSANAQILLFQGTSGDVDEWFNGLMLNTGSSSLPFEPFGFKVPIECAGITYNCYISDVLRKSTGADPVYDIMSSTGTITRNVDTDRSPLPTPTTESFTAPTLATVAGSQSVSFDTTVKPSKAELTYTGWHTHSDKKRSGGAWT